jgi:streptogramin lyase
MPVREADMETSKSATMAPSPYWGDEAIWDSRTSTHSLMMDEKGDVWFTSKVGKPPNPDFCKQGSSHRSAQAFPLNQSNRGLAVYDPKTATTKLIRTCFNMHHVVLGEDADNTVWVSSGGAAQGVIGWLDRKIYEEVQPNQPVDPTKDKRILAGIYGVGINPADGTVWGSVLGDPGYVLRFDPKTKLSEIYEPPAPGYGPRGFDIDRNGIAYVPLSSGHLGAFDRRKCKGPLNGPQAAEGKLCPEGWTLTPFPGPQFRNVRSTIALTGTRWRATAPAPPG